MTPSESALRRTIPVYINNYNQPTYTRRLVQSFRTHGFRNIIVIDQASEGIETIGLLRELEVLPGCRVIRRRSNRGPRYFFDSLRFLAAGDYFLYTDPDVELPEEFPSTFITRMISISNRLGIGKVGCALDLSDSYLFDDLSSVQEGEISRSSVVDFEARYWTNEIEPNVFKAEVDTTLALYNRRYFRLWRFFDAVRVAGNFTIKHRPWYIDKRMPPAELSYYIDSCKYSSWLSKDESGKSLFKLTPATRLIKILQLVKWRFDQLSGRPGRDHKAGSAAEYIGRETKLCSGDASELEN